jgi:hypothetical protein
MLMIKNNLSFFQLPGNFMKTKKMCSLFPCIHYMYQISRHQFTQKDSAVEMTKRVLINQLKLIQFTQPTRVQIKLENFCLNSFCIQNWSHSIRSIASTCVDSHKRYSRTQCRFSGGGEMRTCPPLIHPVEETSVESRE